MQGKYTRCKASPAKPILVSTAIAAAVCLSPVLAEYVKGFDSTEEIAENLVAFLFEGAELFAYADVIRSVTFEEVVSLFDEFFDPACFTLSEVRPLEEGGSRV